MILELQHVVGPSRDLKDNAMPSKDKTSAIQCECRLLNLLFIYVRSKKASKILLAKRNLAILLRRKAVRTISSIFQLLNLVRKLFFEIPTYFL